MNLNMRFFKPLPVFIPWLAKRQKRLKCPVIEIGCGYGELLREMRTAKIPAIGVDPRFDIFNEKVPEDLISCMVCMEAERFGMIKNHPSILLVCRPCHSGFAERIHRIKNQKSIFYYVGLERNLDIDFSYETKKTLVFDTSVGEEGEMLWKIG